MKRHCPDASLPSALEAAQAGATLVLNFKYDCEGYAHTLSLLRDPRNPRTVSWDNKAWHGNWCKDDSLPYSMNVSFNCNPAKGHSGILHTTRLMKHTASRQLSTPNDGFLAGFDDKGWRVVLLLSSVRIWDARCWQEAKVDGNELDILLFSDGVV